MFYLLAYLLYFLVSLLILSIDMSLIISTLRVSNTTALFVIVTQVIIFSLMLIKRRRQYDFKHMKHEMIIECEKPVKERRTYVSVANWLFIVLIYLTNSNISELLPTWAFMINNSLVFVLTFMTLYPLFIESNIEFVRTSWFNKLVLPIVLYFMYLFLNAGYSVLLDFLKLGSEATGSVNQGMVEVLITRLPVRMFLSVVIFAPIMEEWIFRGLGFRSLLCYNKFVAYASTFILFGLVHLSAGFVRGAGFSEFIYLPIYGMMGVVYAYAYDRTGSIYSSMIIHALSNAIAFVMILSAF